MIFIFHGMEGYPEENWYPWLKKELEQKGHQVIVPAFPHTTIFVGHSLGALFL